MSRKRSIVNTEMAKRGVWLVKVPRYLSELWEANTGDSVGHLVISKSQVKLISKPGLVKALQEQDPKAAAQPHIKNVPEEHVFILNDVKAQKMELITEDKSVLKEDSEIKSGRLALEGNIVKKADCRPADNSGSYLKMKISQIQTSMQPKKQVQQLDRAAVKYTPRNAHEESMAKVKAKKEGAKATRGDPDVVRNLIFQAFEKHQFYRLQDLQQLTQQPAGFVKEILQDVAVYNAAPPHKSMWELKPEYRSYSTKAEDNDDE